MKTQEFLDMLKSNQDKSLLFEYTPGQLVGANYHITEVKHIGIDAVDCGANSDTWNETVIQLWESPSEIGKTEFMTVNKATGILNKVGQMKPYDMDSEVKIEYGNNLFHTAHLFVDDFEIHDNKLLIKLAVTKTDCKAKSTCGVAEEVVNAVEKVAEVADACCTPGGGCC